MSGPTENQRARLVSIQRGLRFLAVSTSCWGGNEISPSFPVSFPFVSRFTPICGKPETRLKNRPTSAPNAQRWHRIRGTDTRA